MKRMLSMLALLGTFLLWPLMAQAQEFMVTIKQVEHATITVTTGSYASPTVVQSGDRVSRGAMLTIKVSPEEGYTATHYTINGVPKEITSSTGGFESVYSDMEISAKVEASTPCTVTITPPAEGGTLTVTNLKTYGTLNTGDQVGSGTEIKMAAKPDEGYDIEYWLIDGQKIKPAERESLRYSKYYMVKSDVTVSAQFKKKGASTLVAVTIVQPENGTIEVRKGTSKYAPLLNSGDEVEAGTEITMFIKPNKDYVLDYWLVNGERVEKQAGFLAEQKTIEVTTATTISAVLKESGCKITYEQPEHGTLKVTYVYPETEIPSGTRVKDGERLSIKATVEAGYQFKHFLINGEVKVPDNLMRPYLFETANSDMTIAAVIEKIEPCIVTITPFEHGTLTVKYGNYASPTIVASGDEVPQGTKVTITATVDSKYEFEHFLIDGNEETGRVNYKDENELEYVITKPVTIAVVAEERAMQVVTIEPFEHGELEVSYGPYDNSISVKTGDKVPQGTKLDVYAWFDDGYDIDHFLVNGEAKPADEPEWGYIGVLVGDSPLTISAVAKKTHGQIVMVQPDSTQGKMTAYYFDNGEQKDLRDSTWVALETSVTFHVEPAEGYEMDYWLVNDARQELTPGMANNKVVTVEGDLKVEPVLKKSVVKYTITMIQPKEGEGTLVAYYSDGDNDDVTDGMSVEKGAKITFRVTPAEGYVMDHWLINDQREELVGGSMNNYKAITVEGDLKVEPILKSTAAPVEKVRLSVQEEGVGGFAMVRYQTPGSTTWERPAEGTNPTLDLPIGTKVRVLANISIEGATVAFTHNGNPVAADQLTDEGLTYEFTLEAAADIKVIFTEGVIGFQIFYDCDKHATITGTADGQPFTSGDKLPLGARVELTVTPEAGYEVKDWVDADFVLIEGTEFQNPYTFTVDGSVSVFAEIQKKTTAFVKISYEGPAGYLETTYLEPNGTGNPLKIFGDKRIPLGSVVTVKAKFFMTGDYLVAYTNNGNPVPAEALTEDGFVYTFTANEDADVHAVFSEKPAPAVDYTITFEAGKGGTVTATVDMEPIESGAKIAAGTKIKILATPDEDYEIDEWLVDGEPVANTGLNFYYLSLSKDTNVKVTFRSTKPEEYVVTVDPVLPSAEAGTVQLFKKNGDAVESGNSVVAGTEMYVEVKPADKYELESLRVNNATLKVGDENLVNLPDGGYEFAFMVTEDITFQATFKLGGAVEQLTANQIVAYVTNGGTRLEIAGAAEGTEVRLYDYTGQLLLSSTEHALDISALPAGSYIVLIGNYTTRIVK